ncbi:MAG: DUF3015 family protein [Elusimicrobiales bacterium]|jgi:hypothetical protein|nr:DUF3015 domain-containing protein [Elusimicrobiales bacterium]
MKKIIASVMLIGLSGYMFAADYGSAGCGLGSMLFKNNNEAGPQILASTTNGTSGSQTFGITFGTSNCNNKGLIQASMQRESYIEANYKDIAKDAARGNGEYLTNLAKLYGYENNVPAFASLLKNNYSKIFSANSAKVAVEEINKIAL